MGTRTEDFVVERPNTGVMRMKLTSVFRNVGNKFKVQFGFRIKETTWQKLVDYMFLPKDSSSLAVTRILFGICMLFDIPDERGGATLSQRWGDPRTCHFPLLTILQPMSLPNMAMVYCIMWFGALGMTLGYKYSWSSVMFTCTYWYLFLIEKSFWNNHSYLFGLVAILLSCTEANCYWSLDTLLDPSKKKTRVPYWNYFILKYQFFILYFMAGVKKGSAEWLTGYSVQRLSEHWVFDPFKLFLTEAQTDYLIVHCFIFLFDLTIAVWMMYSSTRNYAMAFCALFHLMNSRIFSIGMFPWVCLATMPLFYPFDWPKRTLNILKPNNLKLCRVLCQQIDYSKEINIERKISNNSVFDKEEVKKSEKKKKDDKKEFKTNETAEQYPNITNETAYEGKESRTKKTWICVMICIYMCLQAFLPFSHFITKGYNNWTDGLYGYSWDMMVHTWQSHSVVIRVADNENNKEYFYDPNTNCLNDRWTRHGDMLYQYTRCLQRDIQNYNPNFKTKAMSENISIYFDIWYSMNGRFTQRMFDPKVDMLRVEWSPFKKIPYLMPLLDEALQWRGELAGIKDRVMGWSNYSNVIFIADFPGYDQEKFIPRELKNVSLTILEGRVIFEINEQSFLLATEDTKVVQSNAFHRVLNIGDKPAYYMYTFINTTKVGYEGQENKQKLPIGEELLRRFSNMIIFARTILESLLY